MPVPLLAALPEPDVLGGSAAAFGLMSAVGGGRIRVHGRYPWGAAVHTVGTDELALPFGEPSERARDSVPLDPRRAMDLLLRAVPAESLVTVPLDEEVTFWAALSRPEPNLQDRAATVLAHAMRDEDPEQARARLRRAEQLEGMLPMLATALDVREVFGRLAEIVSRVLQFDSLSLLLIEPSGERANVWASVGLEQLGVPRSLDVPPPIRNECWEYLVVGDVSRMPGGTPALAGGELQSALSVPVRLRGKLAGGISVLARELSRFYEADALVVRRLADHVALALSHERLAEERRTTEQAVARASQLQSRVRQLSEELDERAGWRRVHGKSSAWRETLDQAVRVAASDTTVLLLGETGTGKEVLARLVHRESPRRDGPFVAVNCAALPEHLLEAELFGYERGAFTGATQTKPGRIDQAAGGVLFLDELGEMTLPAQAKFLRVLQEREYQRLGGTAVLTADIRVVAATNRDLLAAIEQRTFREDLYYRLAVFPIRLPPLRERPEDVMLLAEAFLEEIGRTVGRPPSGISRDAAEALVAHAWPGNVRELRNVLERAAILCDGGLIVAEHLALLAPASPRPTSAPRAPEPVPVAAARDVATMEREMIERALQEARFNKSQAAKSLGLTRAQLYVRLRKYGLS